MATLSFDEIRHDEQTTAHARCSTLHQVTKDMFKPGAHSPALPVRSAAGTTQQAAFHANSPYNEAKQYAHVALLEALRGEQVVGFIHCAYLVNQAYPDMAVYSLREKV